MNPTYHISRQDNIAIMQLFLDFRIVHYLYTNELIELQVDERFFVGQDRYQLPIAKGQEIFYDMCDKMGSKNIIVNLMTDFRLIFLPHR
jgi:hypothetical protein